MGWIEKWADESPDTVAVWDERGPLTYGEWNDAADRLAEALLVLGVGAGSRVAVRMRLRKEWFIANRAIGKLGAEQVALNWRLTPLECQVLLRRAQAVGVICDDSNISPLKAQFADLGLNFQLFVNEGIPERSVWDEALSAPSRTRRIGPEETPQLIFTSGTTGEPKGVSTHDRHDNVEPKIRQRYLDASQSRPHGVKTLLTLPLHHFGGPAEAAATHRACGTVFLLDPFDAKRALRLIEDHSINEWMTVPTLVLRIQALEKTTLRSYDVSSVERLYLGGAPIHESVREWVVETFGNVLQVQYGSTETGAIAALRPEDLSSRPGSIGQPLPGVDVRIVDADWEVLRAMTSGTIAVRTPVMITRYMGMPILDPDTLSSDGFFRTGDLGHLDEDGYLYITGRAKDMILSGGVNIYPAEIEAVLEEHPDVVESAVVGIPHHDLGEQIIAFLEVREDAALTQELVLRFLEPRLARYKRPRSIVVVDSLPRNAVGKVMKASLREPYWRGRGGTI